MSGKADNLTKQLHVFGFNQDESLVYIAILKSKEISALKLSKDLKIARTKVYRLLEKLIAKGFVTEEIKGYGKKFVAQPPEKFSQILLQKESEVSMLKAATPTIVNQLNALRSYNQDDSKILHYQGIEGLKQVTWNSTKAKDVLRIFEVSDSMDAFTDKDFSESVRTEFMKNKVMTHQLTNLTTISEFTEIADYLKWAEIKYIDPKLFKINFEILIYNDVYCLYDYKDGEVFCVEIYNKKLVEMQKQIFDYFWEGAKKMRYVNKNGRAAIG